MPKSTFLILGALLTLACFHAPLRSKAQSDPPKKCYGYVIKLVSNTPSGHQSITYKKYRHSGECEEGGVCNWRKGTAPDKTLYEWCSCSDDLNGGECHLVVQSNPDGSVDLLCAGACAEGTSCDLTETERSTTPEEDEAGIKKYMVTCGCSDSESDN